MKIAIITITFLILWILYGCARRDGMTMCAVS